LKGRLVNSERPLPLLRNNKIGFTGQFLFFKKGSIKMALKNYYIILGISPNTSAEEIRCAFRRLAKRFHPDKAGGGRTAFFQDITEAYEVLSNPEKRKLYNQKLKEENKKQKSIPVQRAPYQYENGGINFRQNRAKMSFQQSEPVAGYRKRSVGYETGLNVLEMDAYLTPQEAASGVTLNLRLTIPAQCHWCEGTGRDFVFNCIRCNGSGILTMERPIEIDLPSRLIHGDLIKTTIALSKENYLHLLVEVYII
jgi:DnaJ-class molecular chaperone